LATHSLVHRLIGICTNQSVGGRSEVSELHSLCYYGGTEVVHLCHKTKCMWCSWAFWVAKTKHEKK